MQQEPQIGIPQPIQLIDQTSSSIISLSQSYIIVKSIVSGQKHQYPLPSLSIPVEKSISYSPLKFTNKNSNVLLNPSGNVLTCKAQTIQQVQMQKSFSSGPSNCWSIYVPKRTLLLSIGVKDIKNKKSINFDFSLKVPAYLTFKLDLENNQFKCWVNQLQSDWHKPIQIEPGCQWTPFIRIKGSGSSVILNSFISDPESHFVSFNPINRNSSQEQINLKTNIIENKSGLKLQKINNDKLLLFGESIIKVINRNTKNHNFNFNFIQFDHEQVVITFSKVQYDYLVKFINETKISNILIDSFKQSQNGYSISNTLQNYKNLFRQILSQLDILMRKTLSYLKGQSQLQNQFVSIQQINKFGKIILSKLQSLRPWLGKMQNQNLLYSQFNELIHLGQKSSVFQHEKVEFKIQKQIFLNNMPYFNINSGIRNIKSTQNSYLAVQTGNQNKISIMNAQYIVFKIIDTFLYRGFNKQVQINQYQKSIQDIQQSDFTKPHIFKILKNCLKYADKIKPPERLLKQIQKKKQQEKNKKQVKKQQSFQVDKSLLNTLVTMGFNVKVSTKALTQIKNSSLQAAIQLILGKYKDQNILTKNTNTPKPKTDWQCQACTLINSKQVSICSACETPAPVYLTQVYQQQIKKQKIKKQQKPEQVLQEQIVSKNLQDYKLLNFFIFHTNVVYCPILLAGVFKDRVRFRLLGPNPKYYSQFYIKDNKFIDLITFKAHQFAHQIDQSQINSLNYLTSTSEQLKKNYWGWMNIQDFDFILKTNETINKIDIKLTKKSQYQQKFFIHLSDNKKYQKILSSKIILGNVFQKKRRCLIIEDNRQVQLLQQMNDQTNILNRKQQYEVQDVLQIPQNGKIVLDFIVSKVKNSLSDKFELISKRSQKVSSKSILPLIAVSGVYNTQLKYPNCTLYSLNKTQSHPWKLYRNGIVFRNPQNRTFSISNLIIQKKDKQINKNTGFVYIANDIKKIPLRKYVFEFQQQGGKTHLNIQNQSGKYLIVVLNPTQHTQAIVLTHISAFGQIVDNNNKLQFNVQQLKVQFDNQQLNNKSITQLCKINAKLVHSIVDIKASNFNQQNSYPINMRLSLNWKNKQMKSQKIKSILLNGYKLLSSKVLYKQEQSDFISQRQYRASLQTFIQTLDPQSFDIIQKQQNQQFRKLITEYDLQQFIVQKLITCPYDKKLKNRLKSFINIFSPYLKSINSQSILSKSLNLQSTTAYGIQLVFVLIKSLSINNLEYMRALQNQTNRIQERKINQKVQQQKYICDNYTSQSSIFSDLYHNLSNNNNNNNNNKSKSLMSQINYHYICEKNKNRRKYIIDLMSLYSLDTLTFKFQSNDNSSKLNILISCINSQGKQQTISQHFYDQHIWNQLSYKQKNNNKNNINNHLLSFNLNKNKTRYLVININLSIIPFSNGFKQDQSTPINQIIPFISGTYIAQSDSYFSQKFYHTFKNLNFINKIQKFSKYSLKDAQNTFYYTIQQLDQQSNITLQQLKIKQNNSSNRQKIVKKLMERSVKNNFNYHYTIVLLLLEQLTQIKSDQFFSSLKISSQILQKILNHYINNQKGLILQKALIFIRKIIKNNKNIFLQLLNLKIDSQVIFNQIFKQINLKNQQQTLKQVQNLINSQKLNKQSNLILNLAWLCKLYKLNQSFVSKLVQCAYNINKYHQIIFIFQKFGWTTYTIKILDKLIQQNKIDQIKKIIHFSKNIQQLCNLAFQQIKSGNSDIFDLVLKQLGQKQRNTKIKDLQNIVLYILDSINLQNNQNLDEQYGFQQALTIINKFGYNQKVVSKLIKIFLKISNKHLYLNELLSSNMLSNLSNQQMIIQQLFKTLNSQSLLQKQQDLQILSQILIFILRKQTDIENQNISISFSSQTNQQALKLFIKFIYQHLNIGGIESAKLIDRSLSQKINIAFNISTLFKMQSINQKIIQNQSIQKIVKWLIINLTNNQKHIKTTNCNRFIKIQQTLWKLLQLQTQLNPIIIAQISLKKFKQKFNQFNNIRNKCLKKDFIKKANTFILNILNKFSNLFLNELLNKNNIFSSILTQIQNIQREQQLQKIFNEQEQLANQFSIYPQSKDKPKDWLAYKNGSKNHVYKIQYLKSTQQISQLILSIDDQFTLSKIIFGFKYQLGLTNDKNVCLPKQITVEGGNSLQKMKLLGKMFQIPDDRYLNYSVKLFGFNANLIKNTQNIQIHCNKNLPIRYLRFRIKSPDSISIEDAIKIDSFDNKNLVSHVNFLSIQGYKHKKLASQSYQLVKCLQSLSKVDNKNIIKQLFSHQNIIKDFKKALLNISFLMKNQIYEKILHRFLMRVCQQNSLIGNQMIQKYLQLQNSQLCSKISSEVIMSNDKQLSSRLLTYFNFIKTQLSQNKNNLVDLTPFLKRFSQIVFYAINRNKYNSNHQISEIKLSIENQIIEKLIEYFQKQQGKNNKQTLIIIQKFIKSILTLQSPFILQNIQLNKILNTLYKRKNKFQRDLLASLIIDHKQSRVWFMENNSFQKLFQQTFYLISQKQTTKINSNFQFICLLSYNSNLKQLINKYQYNIKLFEMLMSKKYQNILSQSQNQQLRKNFVQLISRTSLGTQNQNVIGALLKDSIPNIISQGNQKFVGQIFLPLLNSYQKIPICLLPYSKAENKLISDIRNIQFKNININKKQTLQIINQPKIRLPTNLLNQNDKKQIFSYLIKSSIITGRFNLLLSHNQNISGLNETIQNKIMKNKNPFMVIFNCKDKITFKNIYIVIFYNRPSKFTGNNKTLNWTQGSFIYLSDGASHNLITKPGTNDTVLFQFNQNYNYQDSSDSDEELNFICRYDGLQFINVCYSYNNIYSFKLRNLPKNQNNTTLNIFNQATLNNVQFWNLEQYQKQNKKSIKSQNIDLDSKAITKQILTNNYGQYLFNSKYVAKSSLNSLRYQKVYEFPLSITVSELKQNIRIMNCSINQKLFDNVALTPLGSNSNLQETITLEDIRKIQSLKETLILDFNIDFDNLIEALNLKQQKRKQQTQFLPRKGILKYFQQNDGIHSMIKVIKKSIEAWNNKQRMQKWLQYVIQLQSFSNFPHFFAMYLKDQETFKLLFNLLAGLPDKQTDKKWDQLQATSSLKLLKIVSDILHMDKTSQFRQFSMKNDFFSTILQRLRILTGMFKRKYQQKVQDQKQIQNNNNPVDDDGTKKIKKKKGVGYGNDSSSNTKWMKDYNMDDKKKQFQVIGIIMNIIENFLDIKHWKISESLIKNIIQSALLPFIQDGLRAGTLLQISKHPEKFKKFFKIIRVFSKHQKLVPILLPLSNNYQPRQIQSIQSLLKSLENTASIFLSCLNQNKNSQTKQEQTSQQLAKDIKQTYRIIEQAIQQYKQANMNNNDQQKQMQQILELPLDKKYRALMKDLRFDYIDMKQSPTKIKHHYSSSFNANYTPNQVKMIRLAQQLADISTALPHQHTNAIYVRCDKDRVDFMQALIIGSNGTPYGHGAYLFDVFFDDNYPNGPPKVNLTTTGHGKIRFNPNLYACGKVCLSLLGTWRGSASQNWDPKVSTLLQVLLSIQAIIMSQQVYFNQPGFQNQQGTEQGQKKNQAYSNIVRYGNIKFAMLQNIKNPPKGFETIIKRHFYLKQHEIMDECKKWLKYAQKRAANYIGLVNDHNHSWSTQFKKSKTQYKQMLQKAIQQLQQQFKKLPVPKISDINSIKSGKKTAKKKIASNKLEQLQKATQQQIDVSYDKNKITQAKQIDINDQKVKDRWSRYIGAMGIDAVSKQSKADILLFGLNPFALQVAKNIVLSGCRKLTICDQQLVKKQDLSGGFFYNNQDIGKKRLDSILYKIRQLNAYVKIDTIQSDKINAQFLKTYTIVVASEIDLIQQQKISEICRSNKVKFISADCVGFTCRIVNDLGQKFQVLDKNGQQPVQVFIKDITCSQKGVVTLLDGVKHPFQDGQAILIKNVQGMLSKQDDKKSINQTIHKVKIINSKSFQIGNTTNFTNYIRNGIAKNIKTPIQISYKPFYDVALDGTKVQSDQNLAFYDFAKLENSIVIKNCYIALSIYKKQNKKYPESWNQIDSQKFVQIFKSIFKQKIQQKTIQFVRKFSFTCQGNLPPLCAFFGGLVCQQTIKAITQKFKPIASQFYIQFSEIVPQIPKQLNQINLNKIFSNKQSRDIGFCRVVGDQLLQIVKNSKLFMVGSGAIGCQLLKNFAMIGFGTGQSGKITLTDPDHIQNSNLNRQFLFRQKHISKSKSRTASQAVKLMNPYLKNHISALTQRVSDSTKDIFTNKFFQSLTLVANALDNVAARRYVDQRCVQNKTPLFQSGTLGPKGHVQVIIPYQTESYGSQNDPVQEGQIPHCTLKMFPEETLHCVQWARDIFGKKFSLQPKGLLKVLDKNYKPEKDDIKSLTQSLVMVKKSAKKFDDCISYAVTKFYKYFRDDVMQLLYTYPLDAKTKNGQPFWKLPKRPPTPLKQFNPQDLMHCTFVASLAVMIAKIYQIDYSKNFRTQQQRLDIGKIACKVKIPQFVPSDQKAKQILKQSKQKKQQQAEEEKIQQVIQQQNQNQLYKQIISTGTNEFKIKAQEFQKDDDSNGHIDFIYSMANLRAINYKLDQMQWITVKLKAGRIVPALATTTACVSGLQTLQICKYLKKVKIDLMKNSYLNLAVPSIQMSEPGLAEKKKLTQKLTVNLWDRWQVQCAKNSTFGQLYQTLQKKYQLQPVGILQGMSRIDTGKTQESQSLFLKQKILDKLDLDENYIDIIVLFMKSKQQDKILEGVPPVRLIFK